MTILDVIFANKRIEVERSKGFQPLAAMREMAEAAPRTLNFIDALYRKSAGQRPALIAEIKRASPSHGQINARLNPVELARLYRKNGASAISVLTDQRFFNGSLDDLKQVARLPFRLPLLRKDFLFDPYQVYEARAAGADAVLLIAAGLEPAQLRELHSLAAALGMASLVEVHTAREIEAVFRACLPTLVGINNRNLNDFTVDLKTTLRLRPLIPPNTCVVAESGIHTPADVDCLAEAGVDAILVGEALVAAPDPAAKVRSLSR